MRKVIIKFGGSLLVPDEIDVMFLKEFRTFIEEYVKKGFKFGIVVGGGRTCRKYQDAIKKLIGNKQRLLDELGIEVTKLNAYFLKTIFKELADDTMITDYSIDISSDKPVLIGAGYKPDWSTDYDTIMLSEKFGQKEVIVMSNIEYVYDKDPNKFDDAEPFEKLTWEQMLKLCKGPWKPGLNSPLDPKAAELGAKNNHKIIFLKGLNNLKKYLDGKDFKGTVVEGV